MMIRKTLAALALGSALCAGPALAADYAIDKEGQHAFINFKISHLGYSWLYGTFRDFDGSFSFDAANPAASTVQVSINTASLDSNHAERDKHLRGADFLNVDKHPVATFKSTSVKPTGERSFDITGDLSLNGVTKPVTIQAGFIGEGKRSLGRLPRRLRGQHAPEAEGLRDRHGSRARFAGSGTHPVGGGRAPVSTWRAGIPVGRHSCRQVPIRVPLQTSLQLSP